MTDRPYHHPDLRNRLVAETLATVERDGAGAVTISRIAAACGVSVAAPYRHFPNKEALLGAVAAQGFNGLGEALSAAAEASSDARERLVQAGVAYVDYAARHPHLFRLMFSADLRERQHVAGPAALERLTVLVDPLDLQVPAAVAVRATWALAHGLAELRLGGMLTFTGDDSEERLRAELATLLDGIAPSR